MMNDESNLSQIKEPIAASTVLPQRLSALGIALGALLLIGWWMVSDPTRLGSSVVLGLGDYAGAAFCHRITARTFMIAGRPMPLCARCSGMYIGFIVFFLLMIGSGRERRAAYPPLKIMAVLLLFVFIMGVDGVNSYSHFFANTPRLYSPHNLLRLFTGLGTGIALGGFMLPTVGQVLWYRPDPRPMLGNWGELVGIMLVTVLVGLALLTNIHAITHTLAIFSVLGVLFLLTGINVVLLLVALRRDGQATTFWQAIPWLTLGFLLACVEAGILVYLRVLILGTISGVPGLG